MKNGKIRLLAYASVATVFVHIHKKTECKQWH